MKTHILQTKYWANFKNLYGTPCVEAGGVYYTKHKIPLTSYYYGYAPRVNPLVIDFEKVKTSLEDNDCVNLHFDVPNILRGSTEEAEAVKILEVHCQKSPREEFAKGNVFMNLTKSEKELFDGMHVKHRYNTRCAEKKGVEIKVETKREALENFYVLYKETSKRQGYFPRSKMYIEKLWEAMSSDNLIYTLTAYYQNKPLASWVVIVYENVLYYLYGGSSEKFKNLQASCLLGWEAIKFGKRMGCELFDMWGAAKDPTDEKDPYHGFTNFKLKFGGKHVVYIDSYDLVINQTIYTMFNTANNIRWKILNLIR